MKKRLMMGLAAGALVAAMVPGVASADGPLGACPDDFELKATTFDDRVRPAWNGDGYWCLKSIPQASVGIAVDNHLPLGD